MSVSIVQELRNALNSDSSFYHDFNNAFEKARKLCPSAFEDAEEGKIETLIQYLDFYERLLKWVPSENIDGTFVYNRICLFYFVLDTLPVSQRQSPILPSTKYPYYTWLSKWIIKYAQEIGKWMNTTDSIDECKIRSFYLAEKYHMQDYECVKWNTFNEFFARRIKPECRPIDAPDDDNVIVHPADAKFDGWWPIDDSANCHFGDSENGQFKVKGIPWNIGQLLDDDANGAHFGATFADGKFCHSFLGPHDYHRIHAPVSGKIVQARDRIPGLCYLEVVAADQENKVVLSNDDSGRSQSKSGGELHLAMRRRMVQMTPIAAVAGSEPPLDAPNTAGYQFVQARALILIDNPKLGLVAVLPIGMAQVSSVKLVEKVKEFQEKDVWVKKGEELGYFQFGGSDVVMVFQAKANVEFTAAKCDRDSEDANCDDKHDPSFYPFGKQVAKAHPSHN